MKKVTIAKGLITLINHNVRAKCPEGRIVVNTQTGRIDTHPNYMSDWETTDKSNEIELYNDDYGAIGYGIVTRRILLCAADEQLQANGYITTWDGSKLYYRRVGI